MCEHLFKIPERFILSSREWPSCSLQKDLNVYPNCDWICRAADMRIDELCESCLMASHCGSMGDVSRCSDPDSV